MFQSHIGVEMSLVSRGFLIGLNAETAFSREAVIAGTSAHTTSGGDIRSLA
jgi:hypothetical protein